MADGIRVTARPPWLRRIFTLSRRHLTIYPLLTLMHARPGGGPVLVGESSWRTVNGFMLNGRPGHVIVIFRRWFW